MKIISKFHDYYDTILAYGFDDSIYFNRVQSKETINITELSSFDKIKSAAPNIRRMYNNNSYPALNWIFIGFCGKIYPCIRVYYPMDSITGKDNIFYCYSAQEIIDSITERKLEGWKQLINDGLKTSPKGSSNFNRNHQVNFKAIQTYFDDYTGIDIGNESFHKFKTPLFLIKTDRTYNGWFRSIELTITLNPCLKDVSFFKVKDPYTTFQDIDMFFSGVLGNTEVDTVQINDTDMRDAKGFNNGSFKTRPGTKKPRRKKDK